MPNPLTPTLKIRDEDALSYHEKPRPGKLAVTPTKPCLTQRDLSLAYTPGVAVPCKVIEADYNSVYKYTNKGNLVAVISNGTAVLGLGDIGALAGKPVMEGKGVLFNRFAGIDVFDIEVETKDVDEFVHTVKLFGRTFGGINLEDIKAPECFEIERQLIELLDIPVFHDDQHGTAIISTAGMLNALELQGKDKRQARTVILGAGAAGIAIIEMLTAAGLQEENIYLVDREGVVYEGREKGMNPYKAKHARKTKARTLADIMKGADAFLGVSGPNLVSEEMVRSMAAKPVIFAMANPVPEVPYELARAARPDAIIATGRSDYPNQVNNVLGFPFIFRGALDVRARRINLDMKLAASRALAELARTDVPDEVCAAYGTQELRFGPEYILPKPLDPRVLLWVAPAVAQAACDTGVATCTDWQGKEEYARHLDAFLGPARRVVRIFMEKARRAPAKIAFSEGEDLHVIRAAQRMVEEEISSPILIGSEKVIRQLAAEHGVDLTSVEIADPENYPESQRLVQRLFELRGRKGLIPKRAALALKRPTILGLMMVEQGLADGLVGGIGKIYPDTVRPALQLIGPRPGVHRVSACVVAVLRDRLLVLTDTAINIEPDAPTLAEMALLGAEAAEALFDMQPKIALLSFSNFGSVEHPLTRKVADALQIVQEKRPELVVDGEIMADTALSPEIAAVFPQSRIKGDANVLVFPDLQSGNMAYKLLRELAGAEIVGPILNGLARPVNLLNHVATVEEIVRAAAITALQAHRTAKPAGL
ncbi:MAG: NADP-dependent malic enzyme [Acidobacteria bacterium]|nr:NADP-dependent malic enzyme [Acidobacteriota bacterium]